MVSLRSTAVGVVADDPVHMVNKHPMAHETHPSPVRRGFLWLYLLTASIVVIAVFVQAFSIAAYVRGAGKDALDLHQTVGFLTHSVEILVFLAALGGYWGSWRRVGAAFLLPVIGTIQVFAIGDTNTSGGWINGLHGFLALVVLLFAMALAESGRRSLGLGRSPGLS